MKLVSLCADHQRRTPNLSEYPRGCATCHRINIEREIVLLAVQTLLNAGFGLATDQGGDEDPDANVRVGLIAPLRDELMESDFEYLFVYDVGPEAQGISDPSRMAICRSGWIHFIYGNEGPGVISDYTSNLELILSPVLNHASALNP